MNHTMPNQQLSRPHGNVLTGHNYNKVGASSNMSNGKTPMAQPDWLGGEPKTEEDKNHSQRISNNIQ